MKLKYMLFAMLFNIAINCQIGDDEFIASIADIEEDEEFEERYKI
jgi:hypothetical protein